MKRLIFSLLLLCPVVALSAPNKPTVSGTVSSGNTITITDESGTTFGTHADNDTGHAKLVYGWQNFESVSSFADATDAGDGFTPTCEASNCSSDMVLSTTGNRTNSTKWYKRINTWSSPNTNNTGLFKPANGTYGSYGNTGYISFYFLVQPSVSSGKFIRQWDGSAVDGGNVMYSDTGGVDGVTIRTFDYNADGTDICDGVWHRLEYIEYGGNLNVYIDGILEDSGTMDSLGDGHFPTNGQIQVVFGNGKDLTTGNPDDYYGYDDLYVDFTIARVELCPGSTWATRGKCELQVPTSWSTSSISAPVNQGAMAASSTAYLYVVDSTGAASPPSDPITIGSGGGDTTAPSTTISTTDPSAISTDSLTVTGTASDAVGVSDCKWRIGNPPTATEGTDCTWTSSFSCSTGPGYSSGANTLYVGCVDAAGNWGSDSMVVNYTPATTVSLGSVLLGR